MKLTDLDPQWLSHGGEGVLKNGKPVPLRERIGITLNCPCGCAHRLDVMFRNPVDGQGSVYPPQWPSWERKGETFEELTLTPSIQREIPARCWHGYITNGEIITV